MGYPMKVTNMSQNRQETDKNRRKAPKTAFSKGKSGNPGGRPAKTAQELDLIAACKDRTPEALDVILSIMRDGEKEATRLNAAQSIIERAYGKPVQPQDVKIEGSLHVTAARPKLTRDEWLASLAK